MRKIKIYDLMNWGQSELNDLLEKYPKTKVTYRSTQNRVYAIAEYRTEQKVNKSSEN